MVTSPPAIPTTTKDRVLIIGATGFIGKFVAEASLTSEHPTCLLVRPGPLVPSKDAIVKTCYNVMLQRFLPSEFGHDVDKADPVEPGLTMYKEKRLVRRVVEESGVPFTNICCNSIASWPYHDNCHPSQLPPPLDQLQIYGHGNVKAYFVDGIDIGKFTMKVIDDVRTVNKNVHFRPSNNCYSVNELASLWEKKIGRTIPRVTISEDDLLAVAAENCIPRSIVASFTHDIFIKGCQVNFNIDGLGDVEISTLYPEEAFRSLEDCFDAFAIMIDDKIHKGENKIAGTESVVEAVPFKASCGEEPPPKKCSKFVVTNY